MSLRGQLCSQKHQSNNETTKQTSINMFYSTLLIAATALSGLVSAQNFSYNGPYVVDPGTVDPDLRTAWCRGQTASCSSICHGDASMNNCDPVSIRNPSPPQLDNNMRMISLTFMLLRPPSTTPAHAPTTPTPTSRATAKQSPHSSVKSGRASASLPAAAT